MPYVRYQKVNSGFIDPATYLYYPHYSLVPAGVNVKHVFDGYVALNTYKHYSKRYNRWVTVPENLWSDGASGARDIKSDAWWVHDVLCYWGKWDNGDKLCNWDASTVLRDILYRDGYTWRSFYWWSATFFFGGGKARENGMRRVK